jgi:hypothetical protein
MNANLQQTTAAVLTADQAHLARMNEDVTWTREGLLGRLTRGDRPAAGWRRTGDERRTRGRMR